MCINESWLDKSTEDIILEGYVIASRRDRDDGRKCGGVIVFAHCSVASRVTEIKKSDSSERVWLALHADIGPFLIGVWYRPPEAGEAATIESLEKEWTVLNPKVLGTIIIGDINIHHRKWLRYFNRNSAEGERLKAFCDSAGLRQLVKEPTRGEYLFDLLFTDLDELRYRSSPKIADHSVLLGTLPLPVPQEVAQTRTVWQFAAAEWECLKCDLARLDAYARHGRP